jgi:protein O-mannosyl-transferase
MTYTNNSDKLKRQSKTVAFLLVLVTAVIYSNVLKNDFDYYDDESYITANIHIQKGLSWTSIKWAFTSIGYSDNWHPLTWLSHMLDVQLFGLKPAGHHFTNLFFHILATLLLFGFLFYATGLLWPSTLVAALFALHPLHVESVAWVAERKDVLSSVFWFASLWAYAYYIHCPDIKKYVLVFILFALGLMAKPMLVTPPVILLLLDYWPLERLTLNRRSFVRLAAEKLPLVMLTIVSSIITIFAQHGAIGSLRQYTLLIRISNAINSYCVYLCQAFWPKELSVLYPFRLPQFVHTIVCLSSLIIITAAVIWLGRKKKYLITGWLWYIVSLVPVIGIVQVGSQAHADRYTYIPLIGIFIMVAWSLYAIAERMTHLKKLSVNVVLSAIFICMAIKTREQIGYWQNGITLFSHAFDVTKGNVNEDAYCNFGNLLSQAGRTDEAVSCYRRTLELNPDHAKAHTNYGLLLSDMGKTDEAIAHYLKALEHGPNAEVHNNLGTLLAKMGRTDEARVHFLKALEINPHYGDAHYNFGLLLSNMGQTDEALAHYQKALEINPKDGGAHFNLGILLANLGRGNEAMAHYQKVLEINPNNANAHNNLGALLAQCGRTDEAIAHYRKALEINPDAIGTLQNLAFAFVQKGQLTDAASVLQKALASAKSSGDEARARAIAGNLEILSKRSGLSQENLR